MYILSRTVSKLLQIIGQICAFEAPFGGLEATYDVHLRLIGKLVGDFLLVIIELFSLGAFVLSLYTRLTDRQMSIARCDLTKLDVHENSKVKNVIIYNAL